MPVGLSSLVTDQTMVCGGTSWLVGGLRKTNLDNASA